jgi:hypothetical protein
VDGFSKSFVGLTHNDVIHSILLSVSLFSSQTYIWSEKGSMNRWNMPKLSETDMSITRDFDTAPNCRDCPFEGDSGVILSYDLTS